MTCFSVKYQMALWHLLVNHCACKISLCTVSLIEVTWHVSQSNTRWHYDISWSTTVPVQFCSVLFHWQRSHDMFLSQIPDGTMTSPGQPLCLYNFALYCFTDRGHMSCFSVKYQVVCQGLTVSSCACNISLWTVLVIEVTWHFFQIPKATMTSHVKPLCL